jgi:uncharacterized protein YcbX
MRIVDIYRYPVKSLRGHRLCQTSIERIGLEGDRRWLVVDEGYRFMTIRQTPAMAQIEVDVTPGGVLLRHPAHGEQVVSTPSRFAPRVAVSIWKDIVEARRCDTDADRFLSRVLGKNVSLVYLADPNARPVDPAFGEANDAVSFADGYPILLVATASLADLSKRIGSDVSVGRFRPNLVVEGSQPWAEDSWREIRIGAVRMRVVKPCGRCVVTTRDPDSGEQIDPHEPLKTLAAFHRAADGAIIFGQNVIPVETGSIAIGDRVEVLQAGRSNLAG